ncbi:hypothetical protein AMECASPLE_028810 [Ameca splendens]|uniref:Uncharacterized protein n=1 Tax=Ameca splendens TaxID=208324 RepID=A0ABV1A147_9TELE
MKSHTQHTANLCIHTTFYQNQHQLLQQFELQELTLWIEPTRSDLTNQMHQCAAHHTVDSSPLLLSCSSFNSLTTADGQHTTRAGDALITFSPLSNSLKSFDLCIFLLVTHQL